MCPYLCHGVVDDLLVSHIALVADEQLVDALGGVSVNLLQPLLHIVEGIHIGNIVDDADTVSATVVGRSDGTETLLASGVPLLGVADMVSSRLLVVDGFVGEGEAHNLQLHGLAIELNGPDFLSKISAVAI